MMVITGASGQVGNAVLQRLAWRGEPVRALVRDTAKAEAKVRAVSQGGVEIVEGDFAEPETLDRALQSVDAMFLLCANTPEQVELESNAIDAAARAGVRRVVKLSIYGAEVGAPAPFQDWHGRIEAKLERSGVAFIHLRPNFFMQSLPALLAPDGNLYAPTGEGRIGWVDISDIAAVAVNALIEEDNEGKTYDLTGPESLSLTEVAERLSETAGREIRHVDVSVEAAREGMVSSGMPEWFAEGLLALLAVAREGGLDTVTDAVARMGRVQPRSFTEYVREEFTPTPSEGQ